MDTPTCCHAKHIYRSCSVLVEDRDKIDMLGEFGLEVHSFANMFTVLHNDTLMFLHAVSGRR